MKITLPITAVLPLFLCAGILLAQPYPTRPVRMIVPFPPGSGLDIIARIVGQKVSENLGQPVVIDNRAGAGAILGTRLAAHATPDGYNVAMVSSSHTINASVYSKLPYDPIKDFTPITLLASTPYLLVVNPSLAARSVAELVALAKAKAGQVNYGSGGVGVASHLAGELFKTMSGINIVNVPYRGTAQINTAVASGQVEMAFSTLPATLPLVKAGRLRALAVTSATRFAAAPELPTVAESGIPGFEVITWQGMLAPARTPAAAIRALLHELIRALQSPPVRERLTAEGFIVVGNQPDEFAAVIKSEIQKWTRVVKAAGIKQLELPN